MSADNGPFWPVLLLPFTKEGRDLLHDMFFGGAKTLLGGGGFRTAAFGGPDDGEQPTQDMKCYHCDCTEAVNLGCRKCGAAYDTFVTCAQCHQDQALPFYRPYSFSCVRCGKHWTVG